MKRNRAYIYQISLDKADSNDARIIASTYVSKCDTVLDVGFACGDFGDFIHAEKECLVYGMEYDTTSIDIANKTDAYNEIHQVNLNLFETKDYSSFNEKFDVLALLDILEHTTNPDKSFLKLVPYLKESGICIISLPNISFGNVKKQLLNDDFSYTDTGVLDRTHLRFFTYKTIASFFADLQFEIIECTPRLSLISNTPRSSFFVDLNIKKNPHSYISQYVFKVEKSSSPQEQLLRSNLSVMDIRWNKIYKMIFKLQFWNAISVMLPANSKQRTIAKTFFDKMKEIYHAIT